ncbi:MAG: hypothetical protein EP326_08350 [Deltaproteobacteria bacterium]|nr:MAG: hypothetical protein EP326_08350 [Deltaproteobacteria bacterium]TNF31847.1 MAG: hypothetical protein EP319_00980 [Deltaproteobacteria bacterium]
MMKVLMLTAVLFSSTAFANIGFKSGNKLQAQTLRGSFTAFCPQGSRTQYCAIDTLSPSVRDKFVYSGVDADEVTLTAEHQQGSRRVKTSDFNSTDGESDKWFNLWLASLFQRPLLRDGVNKISYSLKKDGNVVEAGTFEAVVERLEDARCRHRHYTFHSQNDCNSLATHCTRYFLDERYCE